ncbi:MAG: hypothetical protein WC002_10360, partial [Candidatus Muiribacteriota bacterium]
MSNSINWEQNFKEHEKLLEDWKKSCGDSFVKDGVVNNEEYKKSNPKILIVLKEVNDPEGGGWDLRKDFLSKGAPRYGFAWNNVTRWINGINYLINYKKIPLYYKENFEESYNEEYRKFFLNKIAVMNLKKTPGKSSSNIEEIERFAESNSDFLKRQFELINPDIVICGGTGEIFKKIIGLKDEDWERSIRGEYYLKTSDNKLILHHYHPGARIASNLLL